MIIVSLTTRGDTEKDILLVIETLHTHTNNQSFKILHLIGDIIQVLLQPIQPLVLLCSIAVDRLSNHGGIHNVKTGEV